MSKELVYDAINYDVKPKEEDFLEVLKKEKFDILDINQALLKASEYGFVEVLNYLLQIYDFKEEDTNYALCWASFASNSKEVFQILVNSGKFDIGFGDNEALMWALRNNDEGKIQCEDIAIYILNSKGIKLSDANLNNIYEYILYDESTSYKNVVNLIFDMITDENRAQHFFELLVSKSYIKEISKICKEKNKIDYIPSLIDSMEVEDENMSEILSELVIPNDDLLLISIKSGMKKIIKKFLEKGKYTTSVLLDAINIAIINNDLETVSIISKIL